MRARGRLGIGLAAAAGLVTVGSMGGSSLDQLRALFAPQPPDALWGIVDQCVGKPGPYCACEDFEESCCGDTKLPDSAVVWGLDAQYVAIRDMRECGCPESFVSGLALPRNRVSGIEDPRRPEGIWRFAWKVGTEHIQDPGQIALAMNPEVARTQNQMHIHIVRLTSEGRRLLDEPPAPNEELRVVPLASLDEVFAAASRAVGQGQTHEYGILVAKAGSGDDWRMILTRRSSPEIYTIAFCTDRPGFRLSSALDAARPRRRVGIA